MALKRYVGPEESVLLSVAGNEIGTVAKGESIFVPDDVAALVAWPEVYWQDGAAKTDATPPPSKAADNSISSVDSPSAKEGK